MLKTKRIFTILALCAAFLTGLPYLLYAAAETEPNDNMTQADQLKSGSTYSGQLSSCADQDWFSVTVTGPNIIQISTHHTSDIYLWECYGNYLKLTVYDGAGNILANIVDLSCGRDFDVGVDDEGTYYIVIEPDQDYTDCPGGVTQPYTINAGWSTRTTTTTSILTDCIDHDGDGYGINCIRGTDCNDNNPLMNPGLYEICHDGLDNNCNGLTDERNCVHECLFMHLLGEDSPTLANFRSFRDETLSRNAIGRKVIQIYYSNAGSINAALERSPALKAVVRSVLEAIAPMVGQKEE